MQQTHTTELILDLTDGTMCPYRCRGWKGCQDEMKMFDIFYIPKNRMI